MPNVSGRARPSSGGRRGVGPATAALGVAVLLAATGTAPPAVAAPAQEARLDVDVVEVLGPDGGGFVPVEIDERGQVSGFVPGIGFSTGAPLLWADGRSRALVPGADGIPTGLNAWGAVVGFSTPVGGGPTSAFADVAGRQVTTADAVAVDVNELGQVLQQRRRPGGTYETVVDGPLRDTVVPVGSADGTVVFNAITITNEGRVVGTEVDVTTGVQTAVTWTRGEGVTAIEAPTGGSTFAVSGNDGGQVVGGYVDADGLPHAFSWRDGDFTDLGSLGGLTTVAVASGITIPSDFAMQAMNRQALNRRGQVIGTSSTLDGLKRGFVWEDGALTDLGDLPGGCARVTPRSINDRGQVVGLCEGTGEPRAFLWEDGRMQDLGGLTTVGWPVGINERGQIVTLALGEAELIGHVVTVRR